MDLIGCAGLRDVGADWVGLGSQWAKVILVGQTWGDWQLHDAREHTAGEARKECVCFVERIVGCDVELHQGKTGLKICQGRV